MVMIMIELIKRSANGDIVIAVTGIPFESTRFLVEFCS